MIRVSGRVNFEGERCSRTRRVETELEEMRVRAVVRRSGLLQMDEMTARTHLQWGPRLDGILLGISLQWHSEIDVDAVPENDEVREPENCSIDDVCAPLRRRIEVPLVWRRQGLGRVSSERPRQGRRGDGNEGDEDVRRPALTSDLGGEGTSHSSRDEL